MIRDDLHAKSNSFAPLVACLLCLAILHSACSQGGASDVPGTNGSAGGETPVVVSTQTASKARVVLRKDDTSGVDTETLNENGKAGGTGTFKISYPYEYINETKPIIKWTKPKGGEKYDLVVAKDQGCKVPIVLERNLTVEQFAINELAVGSYFVCVYAPIPGKSVAEAVNSPLKFTIDLVVPTTPEVTTAAAQYLKADNFTYTWGVATDETKLFGYTIEIGSKSAAADILVASVLEGNSYKFTGRHGGTYFARVFAQDAARNPSGYSNELGIIYMDTIAPKVPLAPEGKVTGSFGKLTYSWVAPADDGFGVASYHLQIGTTKDGSDILDKNLGNVLTYSFTGTHDVTYYARIKAIDKSANESAYSLSSPGEKVILPEPELVTLDGANEADDGYLNASEVDSESALLTLVANHWASATYTEVLEDGDNVVCDASQTYTDTLVPTIDEVPETDGDYAVCVKLVNSPHVTYGKSAVIERDTTIPTFTSVDLANDVVDTYLNAAERLTDNDLVENAVATNHDLILYRIQLADVDCDDSFDYAEEIPTNDSTDMDADDDYKVCIEVIDYAANPSAYGESDPFTLDILSPTFNSIDLINAAADEYININEHAASTDLVGNRDSVGENTVAYKLVSNATTCDENLTYGASVPKSDSGDFGLGGSYKVCIELIDAALNPATYGASDALTLDIIAPVFTSLDLANDASDTYINLAETGNNNNLASNLVSSGADTTGYKLTAFATTCDTALVYGAMPTSDHADFALDGAYKVCVELMDTAGNETYGSTVQINLDKTVPAFTSLALANDAADGYINLAESSLSNDLANNLVAAGQDTTAYKLTLAATTCDVALVYGALPTSDSGDFAADNSYKVCVKLTDNAGNPAAYGNSNNFFLDKTVPEFTSLALANDAADGYINLAETSLSNNLVENLVADGQDTTEYKLALSATTCDGALTYGALPQSDSGDFAASNSYRVCVKLTDNAGNPAAYGFSNSFLLDIDPPTFSSIDLINDASDTYINLAESNSANALVGNLDAAGQDATNYRLVGSLTDCDGALVYGALPQSDSGNFGVDGDYKVCVQLNDNAGNLTYGSSSTINLDKTVPDFSSIQLSGDAVGGYINLAETSNTNALVASLVATGYDTATYKLTTAATNCDALLTYGTVPQSDSGDFVGDDSYHICIKLEDNAGNPADYGSSSNISLDKSVPNFFSIDLINDASGGYINAAEHLLSNDLVGNLVASGYDTVTYKLTTSATTCNGALVYGALPTSDAADFGVDGTYKVCVSLADDAGNPTAYGFSSNIGLDTEPPNFSSIDLAGDAVGGYINLAETGNSNNLVANLAGSNYDTATYKLVTSATTCDVGLTYGALPKSDSADFGVDDSYKVCVALSDAAANPVAYGESSAINLDKTVPAFTSLALAGDAVGGYVNLAERANANNLVSNLVADGYDTATYKLITAVTDCDGLLVYGALPQSNSGDFGGGDDTYKVCVKLSDNAGNPDAFGGSNNIVLDTDAEDNLDGFTATTHASSLNGTIDVSFDFPAVHAYDNIKLRRVVGTSAPADCTSGSLVTTISNFAVDPLVYNDSGLIPDGIYSYLACIYDAATNENSAGTITNKKASKVHTVFVTSSTSTGDFSGAGGADAICQTAGDTIDNSVTWLALASSNLDAAAVPLVGPIWNNNGTPALVANNHSDFWDATLTNAISFDETEADAGAVSVWSGSSASGQSYAAGTCNSFTSSGAGVNGRTGLANSSITAAFSNATTSCDSSARIYCVSEIMPKLTSFAAVTGATNNGDVDIAIDFPATTTLYETVTIRRKAGISAPAATCDSDTLVKTYNSWTDDSFEDATGVTAGVFSYRVCLYDADGLVGSHVKESVIAKGPTHKVFVTSSSYAANAIDLATADATCDTIGDASVASQTWVALLSDSGNNLTDRINLTTTIVNTNSNPIANDEADFLDGSLYNAISYNESGVLVTSSDQVWTGSTGAGAASANTCLDWTDNSGGQTGQVGVVGESNSNFLSNTNVTCDNTLRLYCVSASAY